MFLDLDFARGRDDIMFSNFMMMSSVCPFLFLINMCADAKLWKYEKHFRRALPKKNLFGLVVFGAQLYMTGHNDVPLIWVLQCFRGYLFATHVASKIAFRYEQPSMNNLAVLYFVVVVFFSLLHIWCI